MRDNAARIAELERLPLLEERALREPDFCASISLVLTTCGGSASSLAAAVDDVRARVVGVAGDEQANDHDSHRHDEGSPGDVPGRPAVPLGLAHGARQYRHGV